MGKIKEFDTSRVTVPLLVHLLEGEVESPDKFLAECRRTLPGFKKMIDPRFPPSMVESRGFYLWVYINLGEKLGQAKAYEIMRIVMLAGGVIRFNFRFDTKGGRSFEKLIEKMIAFNTPPNAPQGSLRIVEQSRDRFEMQLTRCNYWELCCALGIPEATTLICQVDEAFFSSYLPEEVRFSHGSPCTRLVDGAEACRFVFTRILGLSAPAQPVCPDDEPRA